MTSFTGQFWYLGQGNPTDARLAYIDVTSATGTNTNSATTVLVDNNPSTDLGTPFPEQVSLDTAANLYYVISNNGASGDGAEVLVGHLNSNAAPTVAYTPPDIDDGFGDIGNFTIVNTIQIDQFNHILYVGFQEPTGGDPTNAGIKEFTYNTTTGALTPVATNNGFLVTAAEVNGGMPDGIFDPHDFALDSASHTLFFTELLTGLDENAIFRLDVNDPTNVIQLVDQSQFPADHSNGFIQDVEVDHSTGLVYFDTESQSPSPDAGYNAALNKIYYVDETATNGTATEVTLNNMPAGNHFFPGHMVLDASTRQLYVASEETDNGNGTADDAFYVFQLSADGHSATFIHQIAISNPGFTQDSANIAGMAFDVLPTLTTSGTGTHAVEQSANVTLLTAAPTISDPDGDHLASASVQITAGTFSSNENSTADDHLTIDSAHRTGTDTSGTINGTSISYSYNSGTETLTLTGYDTIADYQSALSFVQYFTTGDNPTNYGNNTTRTVTWHVNDGAAGDPSGTNTTTTTLNIDAVNDAPVNHTPVSTPTGNEDQQFAVNGLSVSDVDADPANHNISVAISVLHGTLNVLTNVVNGVTAGEVVGNGSSSVTLTATQNQINTTLAASGLLYSGNANYNGPDTATVVTNDQGHTGSGGAQQDSDQFTITINPVNDAPAGTDNTVTTNEDTGYTFTVADFGFTDPVDAANGAHGADSLQAVEITTLPGNGSLTDNGVAVVAGQFVSAADISGGKLVFTPPANANGSPETSFTFQVQDNGGTANGGVNTDPSPNTMTINVTAVNDAPSGADNTKTILEDHSYTFATADFGFSDPNDTPANSLQAVEITTLPSGGTITDNGVAVTAGQFVSAADIGSGLLVFTPNANANGSPEASFTFQVQDNGGTANGGVDTDPTPNTFTFNVTAVNDAPAGANNTVTTNEDTGYTFAAADFGFTDPNDTPANSLQAVEITTLPGAGSLTDNGVAVTAGQFVSAADINGGLLVFTPAANANGAAYANFTFQVQDNGGTANGGVDTDQSPNTMTVNVTSVNDAPAGADNTKSITENTSYTFATGDFGFTDPNDSPANNFLAVEITTTPSAGTLTDNGVPVVAGQFVSVADISGNKLVFTPAANAVGSPYSNFTFQVEDDGGTANGGVNLDQSANTFTFNVTPPPLVGHMVLTSATEHVALSNSTVVATFTDGNLSDTAGQFSATIDWGDGVTTSGTVVGSSGTFSVEGSHTYADEGTDSAVVTLTHHPDNNQATASGPVTVGENDVLTGHDMHAAIVVNQPFSGVIGHFTDTDTVTPASDFVATIDWGDGTTTSGTVSGSSGSFDVSGTHAYTSVGLHRVEVTLADDAPGTATATAEAKIVYNQSNGHHSNADASTGTLHLSSDGTADLAGQTLGEVPGNWDMVGVGQFSGPSTDTAINTDALFLSDSGGVVIWQTVNGDLTANQFIGQMPTNYQFAGIGDFNGDGKSDVLWNDDAGHVVMWEMNGTQVADNELVGQVPTNWHISSVSDVNGDGMSDIVFTSDAGAQRVWQMNGTQVVADQPLDPNAPLASHVLDTHTTDGSPPAAASILGGLAGALHDQHFLV